MSGTYILVGDSQAVGLQAPLAALLEASGWRQIGAAVHVGWTTGRMVASREAEELSQRLRPDLAIVILGGNDTASARYPNKVTALVDQLRPAHVIWIGPAHAESETIHRHKQQIAAQQRQVAREAGFEWYDGLPMTEDLAHQPDGLHFRPGALREWARQIAAVVTQSGHGVGWAFALAGATLAAGAAWMWWRLR